MENSTTTSPLKEGENFLGFTILRIQKIPEIKVIAYEIIHDQTGAHVLHLYNDDRENLFSVCFRTPAKDSTGVAHIMEHSVLAGSKRYPVKDAFNELAKGSMKTFLNAYTYPDKTIYPVASQLKVDFYNLAGVYTDLVFHPRLLENTFLQEGYHLEPMDINDPNSELTISGIVYNEMKGVYSSANSLLYKALLEGLYPDNTYRFDSGGDPDEIPKLTYDEFKKFHHNYYSPSNAWFFLYGDIPTKEHLQFLKEVLLGFEKIQVDSQIDNQPLWGEKRRIHSWYPISKDQTVRKKTEVTLGWVTVDNTDAEEVLVMQILAIALVGTAGAPLRKALIDSGYGEDLSPATGLEKDLKQIPFIVGLRGTEPEKAESIEQLITETLKNIIKDGLNHQLIEGALHQVEFHGKEISRGITPYSIILMARVFHSWLYGSDPLMGLHFSTLIEKIKNKWREQPNFFEQKVNQWLLENTHCLRVVLEPSTTFQEEKEADFRRRMSEKKASHTKSQIQTIYEQSQKLIKEQMTPDSPESLATLPRLELEDLPKEIETIPIKKISFYGIPFMEHEIFANGIAYLDLVFDVSDVADELHPFLPLLSKVTLGMGAGGKSYDELSSLIALRMGGLSSGLSAGTTADGLRTWQKMIFRVKALHRNIHEAVKLIIELLSKADFSDRDRLRDIISEGKNQMIAAVVPGGHVFARRTASAGLSSVSHREEQWNGLKQLHFLTRSVDTFNNESNNLYDNLVSLKERVFTKQRLTINLTGDAEGLIKMKSSLSEFIGNLKEGNEIGEPSEVALHPINFGIAIPAQVCYVAQVFKAPNYLTEEAPALLVISHELSSGFLYNRIRVQGGAYGGFSAYDSLDGEFSFLSYRDPNLEETLKVYQEGVEHICSKLVAKDELRKAIISTIATLDRPLGPGSKGYAAMIREFCDLTDDRRRQFREKILEVTPGLIQKVALNSLKPNIESSVIAVYAAEDRLKRANNVFDRKLKIQSFMQEY